METSEKPVGIPLTENQKRDWLRLIRTENVGPITFRQLLNRFGSAASALEALPELAIRGGGRRIRIPSLKTVEQEIEDTLRMGASFLCMGEPNYPRLLKFIDGAPPVITVMGSQIGEPHDVMYRPTIAIVGSRNASTIGRKMASILAREAGEAGLVVASGLARGIDAAAHESAISLGTIAVLASGLGKVYPPEHRLLLNKIIENNGVVFSEMPFSAEARPRDFPRRNRLISGISLAVVVVEAAFKSGSLHTAHYAAEQGRLVLAVPGSPLDPRCEGTNTLIRDGATLITKTEHLLEAVSSQTSLLSLSSSIEEAVAADTDVPFEVTPSSPTYTDETDEEDLHSKILRSMSVSPVAIDDIIRHTNLPTEVVLSSLLELDLAGRIEYHSRSKVGLRIQDRRT